MKHILLAAITLYLLVSCSQSEKKLIEREFHNHVKLNFDDPKSLNEIVSITPTDTISPQKIKSIAELRIQSGAYLHILCDSLNSDRSVFFKNHVVPNNISEYIVHKVLNLIEEIQICTEMELKTCVSQKEMEVAICEMIDSIKYEPPIYEYKIKFRQKQGGELHMVEYYGCIDSLTRAVVIRNKPITSNDVSQHIHQLMEANKLYSELQKIRLNNIKKGNEILLKLRELTEQ